MDRRINDVPWVQEQVLDFMRTTTRHAFKQDVWDEKHPELWLVAKQPQALGFPAVAVTEMPVPEEIWASAPPNRVVSALGASVRKHGSMLTLQKRRELHGIVMFSETWDMVTPKGATQEEKEQAYAYSQERGLEGHPWAVDAMTAMCRDVDGWDIFVSRRRDGSILEWACAPGEEQAEGRIPAGLDELLDALR